MEQPQSGHSPAAKAVAGILLLIGVVATLIVPIYARTGPKLGGWPFFYWYQMIWIPLVAILATSAYLLLRQRPASTSGNGTGAGQ